MANGSAALAFAALVGGGVVMAYGIKGFKTAQSSAATPVDTSGQSGNLPNPSTAQGGVVTQVASVLRAGGLNDVAIAGVLGNAYQESSWNPSATDGNGNGGLWGFTSSPNSLADLQAYATQHGQEWTNPTVQAEFLLTVVSSSDITTMNKQSSPGGAAEWFMNNWEHPLASSENLPRREQGAQLAYQQITGGGNG